MCFDSVETARLMDDCICRGGFAVVIFAGFKFCWIQVLLCALLHCHEGSWAFPKHPVFPEIIRIYLCR